MLSNSHILFIGIVYMMFAMLYIQFVFSYQRGKKNNEHPVAVVFIGILLWWVFLPRLLFSDDEFLK